MYEATIEDPNTGRDVTVQADSLEELDDMVNEVCDGELVAP